VLTGLGLGSGPLLAEPMTGGVSSDIWLVNAGTTTVVAKRALAQLRVAAVWEAPVERSASEAAWLAFADTAAPGCCPTLLGFDPDSGWVVMEYLDPRSHTLWKADLLAGLVDVDVAAALGDRLARIQSAAVIVPDVPDQFANEDLFDALRLDPYLRSLIPQHPAVADRLDELIRTTATTRRSLVHGDVSPKNVLVGPDGPVLLDAETATWGDPAFDVAFLLNHLCLKAVHLPGAHSALAAAATAFVDGYFREVRWEPARDVFNRAAALLPALALARIDGKSPVEYLDDVTRDLVRQRALRLLSSSHDLARTVTELMGIGP
jgi:5-methylthioribose kinase